MHADPNQARSAAIFRIGLFVSLSLLSLLLVTLAVAVSSGAGGFRGVESKRGSGSIQLAYSGAAVDTPTPLPTPQCGLEWRVVSGPTPSSSGIGLADVVAIARDDVWAVGSYNDGTRGRTLTMHWDGSQWSHISSATVITGNAYLAGVDALSSDNVWAVGQRSDGGVLAGPICLHWDGSQWSIVPMPEDVTNSSRLMAVYAISSDDIWAVGSRNGNRRTLTMHWDGNEWAVVPSPNIENGNLNNELWDVSAVSADDVWAVGYYHFSGATQNLIMHWDGSEWSMVPSPNPSPDRQNHLWGVAAISSDDVWTVGESNIGGHTQTVMLHWDGNEWTRIPSPNPNPSSNYVNAVRALSSNDVWAVGYFCCYPAGSMTLHWDGSQWSHVPSPNIGSGGNILIGVSPVSEQDVWAVGYYTAPQAQILIERYSDPCVTPSPSPSPSPSATATATTIASATPATVVATSTTTSTVASATSIPTPCTITFNDVDENNTFYASIRCLACRGIVSGYSDGTFRPNNQVTRGQLAKMVSNSASFSEPVSGQTFTDVPPTHTFYQFIQRLTTRGHMTGYVCGGPGEPCVNNMPYFRPGANATRGQTSKIVANAAGFTEPPVGQTFQDVPPTHTFYEFIQRLATRNVMQGYNCGGPGEPCVGPENRPYFRPGNDVTRGQSAKIVANAFFPGCVTP